MKRLNLTISDKAVFFAILSAILYALCIPAGKLLSPHIPSSITGGLLYFGAGTGLWLTTLIKRTDSSLKLTKKELPYLIAMVLLDISAIILLMTGLTKTTGANASLLGNFELVATSIAAFVFFKEMPSKNLYIAVILITLSCSILTFEGYGSFIFNTGSILVLLSAVCWGFENNCTKMLSIKDTRQITIIKGVFSGAGCLIISQISGEIIPEIKYVLFALLAGFVSYGVSVCMYIYAQRFLGAVKTASYYSTSPFWGVVFCFILLGEKPSLQFYVALLFMIAGTVFVARSSPKNIN